MKRKKGFLYSETIGHIYFIQNAQGLYWSEKGWVKNRDDCSGFTKKEVAEMMVRKDPETFRECIIGGVSIDVHRPGKG